jgi:multisubunit Na+/H+ antiporter MnhG subunit
VGNCEHATYYVSGWLVLVGGYGLGAIMTGVVLGPYLAEDYRHDGVPASTRVGAAVIVSLLWAPILAVLLARAVFPAGRSLYSGAKYLRRRWQKPTPAKKPPADGVYR